MAVRPPFDLPGVRINNASQAGGAIAAWSVGQPIWTPRNYAALAEEAFTKNAIGYRCTKMISEASGAVPLILMQKKARVEEHDLLKLLASPAPNIGGRQMLEAFFAYLLLEGSTYLEGVAPFPNRPPKELWNLRPDRMKVVAGGRGLPEAFTYQANGQTVTWDVDIVTGRSPILQFKEFHPLNDWYGLSRVEPAAYGIDQHNALSKHNTALVQNGARPSGALIFKPVTIGGAAQSAPTDVIETAEKRLEDRHAGALNAGRPLVLGGNIDWQEMGMTPRDGDFGGMRLDAGRDICSGFGVPHELIIPGQASFNNRAMARLELYEDTVLPLVEKAIGALNSWLTVRYGDGLRLVPDLNAVSALEPRRETKRKGAIEGFKAGLLRRDEAREQIGQDKIGGEEGEAFFEGPATADPNSDTGVADGTPDKTRVNPDQA
jgi:HK97 family phage portal protein